MNIIVCIIVVVIVLFLYFVAPALLAQSQEPPRSVQAAVMAEAIFGILLAPIAFLCFDEDLFLMRLLLLLSVFWIGLAFSIYKASRVGRTIFLILSILRISTVAGIPFSIFSLYKLYFMPDSKKFFRE